MGGAPARWTIGDVVGWTAGWFRKAGLDSPRLDAELLVAHALGVDRMALYVRWTMPLKPGERAAVRELVRRRASERVPVAYLTGRRAFYGLDFEVSPAVLIPRPETEALVEAALAALGAPGAPASGLVADVGTGSGAIAIALAIQRPDLEVLAIDNSAAALDVAARNVARHGVADRVRLVHGDLLEPAREHAPLRAVVSNPPYIDPAVEATLAPEITRHEPRSALYAAQRGMAALWGIVTQATSVLHNGGTLALECGSKQQVDQMLEHLAGDPAWLDPRPVLDVAGAARGVQARVG